jgi:DNA-binding CsgD family transcriptional regulator/dihydrodipicolinate synthase/N-acetylneuraminate lyase
VYVRSVAIVGRDAELGELAKAVAEARDGRGTAVFLVGESGIGKTRLATEAASFAAAASLRLFRGRSSAIGSTVPFRALTEALLSGFRTAGSVDAVDLGAYRPILGRLIPDWSTGGSADSEGSLVLLAEGVLRLTTQLGRDQGCMIVLDDLQDADADTLAVLEYLVDNLGNQRTLLVGAIRADPSPALELAEAAAQRGTGRMLYLDRLDRAGVGELVESCLAAEKGLQASPRAFDELVEQVWTDSAGIPFVARELLNGMVAAGLLSGSPEGWSLRRRRRLAVPATVTRVVADRVDRLGADARMLLLVACVLGQRFPLDVLQVVAGVDERQLLEHLMAARRAQLVQPDEVIPNWYGFDHPLAGEALLTLLAPQERAGIARRAADAIERLHPGLPGEWCQLAASMRVQANENGPAGRLYTRAAERALRQGAANSAVALLDRARELLADEEPAERVAVLAALLNALVESGRLERAQACADELDQLGGIDPAQWAALHTRLAWVAYYAGRVEDCRSHVDAARRALAGGPAAPGPVAEVDTVESYLLLVELGPDCKARAEALARAAAAAAEAARLPAVACQAWQLLAAVARHRDLNAATHCLEHAYALAEQHQLQIAQIHALIRLGGDDILRSGEDERLERGLRLARGAGAVTAGYFAEANLCLHRVLCGDFPAALALTDRLLPSVSRLPVADLVCYLLLMRAIAAGHAAQRPKMEEALAELRDRDREKSQYAALALGQARAMCALLEEERERGRAELAQALEIEAANPTIFHLAGRYGLDVLLRVLAGEAGWAEYEAVEAMPSSQLRWNRHFMQLVRAVLHGRSGHPAEAAAAFAQAQELAAIYPTARHLGLRLTAEAAIADSWGDPLGWLRTAEEYFHSRQVPAVAGACRRLLRSSGIPVQPRRDGVDRIPAELRAAGVTVREYETLLLLAHRYGNRDIAARLGLSPRTVEKYVANLIEKTGQDNRRALAEYAARIASG